MVTWKNLEKKERVMLSYGEGDNFFQKRYDKIKGNCYMYDVISSLIWFSRPYPI